MSKKIIDKLKDILAVRDSINESTRDFREGPAKFYDDMQYGGRTTTDGHCHMLMLNEYGDGCTAISNGHYHLVERYRVRIDRSGETQDTDHSHGVLMDQMMTGQTTDGYIREERERGFGENPKEKITVSSETPHYHEFSIEVDGTGETKLAEGHKHEIENYRCMPAEDGHSHYNMLVKCRTDNDIDYSKDHSVDDIKLRY